MSEKKTMNIDEIRKLVFPPVQHTTKVLTTEEAVEKFIARQAAHKPPAPVHPSLMDRFFAERKKPK